MIVVLISWMVILYMISITGIIAKQSLNLSNNKAFTLLYGIIFQTLFIASFAFFYKIGTVFFIINALIIIFLSIAIKDKIKPFFNSLLESFDSKSKVIFFVFIIITALKSAQSPSIFDNETYYIQTIKWLNEYGYVKGIANVHPFLAQCSFWHVFQSGFNFTFITNSLNDVNGLMLIIGFYYFLEKNRIQPNLFFIVNGLFLVIYTQFIDAPSPDLPILVFLSILFNELIFNTLNTQNRRSLILFLLFSVFIKLTVVPLLLLLLYLVDKNRKAIVFCVYLSFTIGVVWVIKNIIITGYPLFPLSLFDFNFDWKLPIETMDYMYKNINNLGYAENATLSKNYNLFQKLNFWIHLKGINGFFNIGMLFLFIITPFTKLFKSNFKFKILYCILLIHFVFLLLNSPQYRFFLATYIYFGSVIMYEFFSYIKFKNRNSIIIFSMFLIGISLVFDVKNITNNSMFNLSQIIKPESNSKYKKVNFEEKKIGNFLFYDPKLTNLYETSNGNLPCVNEKLFDFYSFYPQLRTSSIKDGFYSKKIEK
jgi:hypothetical protein